MANTKISQESEEGTSSGDTDYSSTLVPLTIPQMRKAVEFIKCELAGKCSPNAILKAKKDLSNLNSIYDAEFSKISRYLEYWATKRLIFLNDLEIAEVKVRHVWTVAKICKVVFPTTGIAGIIGTIGLKWCRNETLSKIAFVADVISCLTLVYSMFQISVARHAVLDIAEKFHQDWKVSDYLQPFFKMPKFDEALQKFVPLELNMALLKDLLGEDPPGEGRSGSDDGEMRFLTSEEFSVQISLPILLSYSRGDLKSLQDVDLLSRVHVFSQSMLAKKWWSRLWFQTAGMLPYAQGVYQYLSGFNPVDAMEFSALYLFFMLLRRTRDNSNTVGYALLTSAFLYLAYSDHSKCTSQMRVAEVLRSIRETYQQVYRMLVKAW